MSNSKVSEERREKIRAAVTLLTPGIFTAAASLYRGVRAVDKGIVPTVSAAEFIEVVVETLVKVVESGLFDE